MNYPKLVEEIAMRSYYYDGMSPEDYEMVFDESKSTWKKTYDFQKEEDCLAEHERDDYRAQATQIVSYLLEVGLIDITKAKASKPRE